MATSETSSGEISKTYNPTEVEDRLYAWWESNGWFKPEAVQSDKPAFCIIMPPPNVTGELHLGHALVATISDILVRWHRMRGEPTLWLPGEDHAGIAAQWVMEQELAKEGKTRQELGRAAFLERMWDWMNRYRHIIMDQHKKLGTSCDWDRERFTMDPGPSHAVLTTFVNYYHKGLIYRGHRIINWCPRCATALSDLEVDHEEAPGALYYVRYPLVSSLESAVSSPRPSTRDQRPETGDFVTVATTRPETILGDTAVAVNPDDPRYQALVGKMARLPVLGRLIPVIADTAVDTGFGTGALKITPAHDPVDFEVGQRHGLPAITAMNLDGTMNAEAGPYQGMDRYQCREAILQDLETAGLLEQIDPTYVHAVGHCYRCHTVVEPIISEQWFLNVQEMAKRSISAVQDGEIAIVPQRFEKVYYNWLENIRDWCISRQLWWGYRIPAWYCDSCSNGPMVQVTAPATCPTCGGADIAQDPDVLDTWFSSGLWPHSTLGWPDDTQDLERFYPTSLMVTGYDILFFWVARMVMMGLENTNRVPFQTVYLHGLIRDEHGEKMSKSKGNVVSPVDTIQAYGTDALRFTLATGSTPGNDMKLSNQRLEASRNFANKLWNASRFVMSNLSAARGPIDLQDARRGGRPDEDRWIMDRLDQMVRLQHELLSNFQLGEAGRQLHDFLWNEYCDWYIEMAKVRLRQERGTTNEKRDTRNETPETSYLVPGDSPLPVLAHVLETSLRLLHPFMPYVTEEIWGALAGSLAFPGGRPEALIVAPYPRAEPQVHKISARIELPAGLSAEIEVIPTMIEIVRAIRNARAERGVPAARWVQGQFFARPEVEAGLRRQEQQIRTLARLDRLEFNPEDAPRPQQAVALVLDNCEVFLPLAGLVDLSQERDRTERELAQERSELERVEAKLANPNFVERAPAPVVEKERVRLAAVRERLERLEARRADLG